MIPSTLLQGLPPKILPDGFSFGHGENTRAGGFAEMLGRMAADGPGGGKTGVCGGPWPGGKSILTQLKKEFMSSGHSLEDYTANGHAVAAFGNVLAMLGFSTGEIEEMVSDLNSRAFGDKVTLADLFQAASQLTEPDEGGDMSAMLDASSLSDLAIILGLLGLDHRTGRNILSEALVEGKGIDPGILAAGIRRAMTDMKAGSDTAIGHPAEVLDRMRRIGLPADGMTSLQATLDELIPEVTRMNDAPDLAKEDFGANGIFGSLLLSYLHQLVAPLGKDGGELQRLIASAGKENGGFDGQTLLASLVQLKQQAASAGSSPGTSGSAGAPGGAADAGEMSLERFVALLERRIAEADSRGGAAKAMRASRPMAEAVGGFTEGVSLSAESTSGPWVPPVYPEGDKPFQAPGRTGAKRFSNSHNRLGTAGSALKTAAKDATGQDSALPSRQTMSAGGGQRQVSSSPSGGDPAEKLSETLSAGGRGKTDKTTEDPGPGTEGYVREMKAGDEAASFGKPTASRSLPGYLLNQVSRQIVRLRNAGQNELTLQLKPPHLGRMKLNVENTAGGIRVGIVVESTAARDLLLANSHDLKAALAEQGVRLERIDVEARADFGQSMAQTDGGFGQTRGQRGRWPARSRADAGGISESPAGTRNGVGRVDSGRLDLVA